MAKSTVNDLELYYRRLEHNFLLDLLRNKDVAGALAYMVSYKNHKDLSVFPKPHSIEISNKDITIAVIIFSGFERQEYDEIKSKQNFHPVSFSQIVFQMYEFKKLEIKFIDKMSLLHTVMAKSKKKDVQVLNSLINLEV